MPYQSQGINVSSLEPNIVQQNAKLPVLDSTKLKSDDSDLYTTHAKANLNGFVKYVKKKKLYQGGLICNANAAWKPTNNMISIPLETLSKDYQKLLQDRISSFPFYVE